MSATTVDPYIIGHRNAAAFLRERGYPCAETSLRTYACRGTGPVFRRWGGRIAFLPGDLLAWSAARMSGPLTSTRRGP
jgi:hypothetical protein